MRLGVTLPQFREDAEPLFSAAERVEALGLDGVFVFDHLWPIGRPDRPALPATVLIGALAASTSLTVGTLVSRVGLRPDALLVHELETAARMAPGRFIAGLGTGDRLSAAENVAYGVAYTRAAERLGALDRCMARLQDLGIPVWVGGTSGAIRQRAGRADALNLWGVPVDEVADASAAGLTVTWGGPIPVEADPAAHLAALEEAGAAWAVVAWREDLDALADARPRPTR